MNRTPPHQVRIIGGRWKRSRLGVADREGLRPTPDRVRETLFNWLGQDLTGWRCVDAFAGTGALGFEAASRGASDVLLIEQDRHQARALEDTRQRLGADGVRIRCGDALSLLAGLPERSVDLLFVDPPFAQALHAPALAAARAALSDGARVYLEAPRAWDAGELDALGLGVLRHMKAGAVHAHLLVRTAMAHV